MLAFTLLILRILIRTDQGAPKAREKNRPIISVLSLISIHTFRLSLTLSFVREKYLGRKINIHFLRVSAKNCRKRKLVWSSIILVLRTYWGLSSLRPHKAVGRPFCKNFLILVKCPRDSRKKPDWFRFEKISQKLKYLNFKCEQSGRSFFVLFCSFHHSAHVPCEKFRWRQAKSVSGNQA